MRPPWPDDHGLADRALDVYAMGGPAAMDPVKVNSAPRTDFYRPCGPSPAEMSVLI